MNGPQYTQNVATHITPALGESATATEFDTMLADDLNKVRQMINKSSHPR